MAYYWSIDAEAGPSRRHDPPERTKTEKSTRRRRKGFGPIHPVIPILSFLTPSFAQQTPATRPYPPPIRPTTPPTRRAIDDDADSDVVYVTKVLTPTDLPTDVVTLDQRVLPYYLTQAPEGGWGVANNAWKLYGREAGSVQNGAFVGGPPNGQFLVESSLPRGWGQQSNRTSIYRVPLIAMCSVILAFVLVVGIISLILNRRKAARKAKRRAERQRRKQLIAAGLNPDATSGDHALQQKIAELDTQHWMKKKKDGQIGFVRVKVKKWSHGLRRRKGKGEEEKEPEPTIEVIEPKQEEENTATLSTPVSSVATEEFTDRSDPPSTTSSAIGSRDQSSEEVTPEGPENGPYLPPEYRPASVNEYSMQEAGPSGGTRVEAVAPAVGDKTTAPGYYPAPATQDMEEAVAVVSHAEGKRPLPAAPAEDEERVRHIATDDKRVLEQMRLGASAPPQMDTSDEAGPSAPHVEVDVDGFERSQMLETVLAPITPLAPLHPDLPAPPQAPIQRLGIEPTDELHLVASEPPRAVTPFATPIEEGAGLVPSAPPLVEEEDEDTPLASVPTPPAPSAPAFEIAEMDEAQDDGELESEPRHADVAIQAAPSVFLPKYEP